MRPTEPVPGAGGEASRRSPGAVAAPDVTVAHVTDPHLFAPRALGPTVLFDKRLLGATNALLRRRALHRPEITEAALGEIARLAPDHLVVSGDISTIGAEAELRAFRLLLERAGWDASRVTVVPGNHDAYVKSVVRRGFFESVFGEHQRSDPPFDDASWPRVRLRGPLAVVACTSARPSGPLLARGSLGARQRARLEAVLSDARLAARFRLVVVHHPVQPGAAHWHNELTDGAAVRGILGRAGAELVVHGHLHRWLRHAIPGPHGPIPVLGAPSVSSTDPRPARRGGFAVYRIRQGRLVDTERWEARATTPKGSIRCARVDAT